MKQEKHIWEIQKIYLNKIGEPDYHYITEYKVCKKCGTRRPKDQYL